MAGLSFDIQKLQSEVEALCSWMFKFLVRGTLLES